MHFTDFIVLYILSFENIQITCDNSIKESFQAVYVFFDPVLNSQIVVQNLI